MDPLWSTNHLQRYCRVRWTTGLWRRSLGGRAASKLDGWVEWISQLSVESMNFRPRPNPTLVFLDSEIGWDPNLGQFCERATLVFLKTWFWTTDFNVAFSFLFPSVATAMLDIFTEASLQTSLVHYHSGFLLLQSSLLLARWPAIGSISVKTTMLHGDERFLSLLTHPRKDCHKASRCTERRRGAVQMWVRREMSFSNCHGGGFEDSQEPGQIQITWGGEALVLPLLCGFFLDRAWTQIDLPTKVSASDALRAAMKEVLSLQFMTIGAKPSLAEKTSQGSVVIVISYYFSSKLYLVIPGCIWIIIRHCVLNLLWRLRRWRLPTRNQMWLGQRCNCSQQPQQLQ